MKICVVEKKSPGLYRLRRKLTGKMKFDGMKKNTYQLRR